MIRAGDLDGAQDHYDIIRQRPTTEATTIINTAFSKIEGKRDITHEERLVDRRSKLAQYAIDHLTNAISSNRAAAGRGEVNIFSPDKINEINTVIENIRGYKAMLETGDLDGAQDHYTIIRQQPITEATAIINTAFSKIENE